MKEITIDTVLSWDPCEKYTEKYMLKLANGKKSLTPLEIIRLKISVADKIWVLLRQEVLGEIKYKEIGYKIADRSVEKHCIKCGIKEVEIWAKKWLSGDKNTDRAAHAVYAAHASDAAYAAHAAAYYAFYAAYAAHAADAAYATDAAYAAYAAEKKWQLNLIKKYL